MTFSLKKIFVGAGTALVLAGGIFPATMNVSAASENFETVTKNEAEDLKEYVAHNEDGTITFNGIKALEQGYSLESITQAKTYVEKMNHLVLNHNGVITEDLTVTAYIPTTGISILSARGVNKIETSWFGPTKIYMDSQATDDLLNSMSNIGSTISVSGLVGLIQKGVFPQIGSILTIAGAQNAIQTKQLENAAAAGNGVIMNVQDTVVGTTVHTTVWFTSQ